jgi:hypothetical protein
MTHDNAIDGGVDLRQCHREDTCQEEVPHCLGYQIGISCNAHLLFNYSIYPNSYLYLNRRMLLLGVFSNSSERCSSFDN